jgi:large subunit ribosomal protein L31
MKEGIHPNYIQTQVECACGNRFITRSVLQRIRLELCSDCHPFYTGRQKIVDTAGRLEKFNKRYAKTEGKTVVRKPVKKVAPPTQKESKNVTKILRNTPRVVAPVKGQRPGGKEGKPSAPKAAKPTEAKK